MPQSFTRDRASLEKAIREGGSVMLPDGRIVTRVEELPDESVLAGQDVDRHQAEVNRLQAMHDQTGQQLKSAQGKLAEAKKAQGQAQPKAAPPAAAGDDATGGAPNYDSWTVEQLHAEAAKRDLHGRGGLDKAGLVKALQKADKPK